MRVFSRVLLLLFLFTAFGCGAYMPYKRVWIPGLQYEKRAEDAQVDVYKTFDPERTFKVIGFVETRAATFDEALPELEALTRKLGGDAILSVRVLKVGKVKEDVLLYSATAIRYIDPSEVNPELDMRLDVGN